VLRQEKEALAARVQELTDKARESEERERHWESQCATLEQDIDNLVVQYNRTREDMEAMVESNRVATGHVHDLQSTNARLESRVRHLEDQLQRSQAKYGETSALLNVRSAELKGAQVFLSKADLYAGGEIIQMINALNEEIFQFCANIAEGVVSEQEKSTEDESTLADCRSRITDMIGQRMVTLLEASREVANGDTLPLQTALQILLVTYCEKLLRSFDFEDAAVDKKLALIYQGAHTNGTLLFHPSPPFYAFN
jgi:chromosome segregation ATPase